MPNIAKPTPGKALLSPSNHALVLIDFQSQMAFATKSIDAVDLRTNADLAGRGRFQGADYPHDSCREEFFRPDV
jgi:hypothetical protein